MTNGQRRAVVMYVSQRITRNVTFIVCTASDFLSTQLPLAWVVRMNETAYFSVCAEKVEQVPPLCQRERSTIEIEFCLKTKNRFLSHPLGDLGVTYALHL